MLGDDRLSYAEADAGPPAIAKGLLATGAGKGTRVALLAGNSPEWIVGWLGITRIGGVAILLNTYSKAAELGWLLRHSDAQVLLTVDAHLGEDHLERLEQAVPGLAAQRPGRILVESHPYLRAVWTWGAAARPWSAPIADLVARRRGDHRRAAAACEAEVTPADPDGGRVLVGQHRRPQGRRPRPRRVRPPRPQPVADARPRRGRRALHADAAVLGGRASASR